MRSSFGELRCAKPSNIPFHGQTRVPGSLICNVLWVCCFAHSIPDGPCLTRAVSPHSTSFSSAKRWEWRLPRSIAARPVLPRMANLSENCFIAPTSPE
jgi:hypothetical protein